MLCAMHPGRFGGVVELVPAIKRFVDGAQL
jgi:hypothetical protein